MNAPTLSAATMLIPVRLRANSGARARGHRSAYDSPRTCARTRGTLTSNSCGGENWQSSSKRRRSGRGWRDNSDRRRGRTRISIAGNTAHSPRSNVTNCTPSSAGRLQRAPPRWCAPPAPAFSVAAWHRLPARDAPNTLPMVMPTPAHSRAEHVAARFPGRELWRTACVAHQHAGFLVPRVARYVNVMPGRTG